MKENTKKIIEAILFSAGRSVSIKEIAKFVNRRPVGLYLTVGFTVSFLN